MQDKPLSIFEVYDLVAQELKGGKTIPPERLEAIANFPLIPGKQALYVVDWRKADVIYSRGVHDMMGYDPEIVSATDIIHNYHPQDKIFVKRIIRGTVRHFVDHSADGQEEYLNITYRLKRGDGSFMKVLRQSTVFLKDAEGKPTMNMSLITDISFISNNDKVEWDVYATKLNRAKLKQQVFAEFLNFFTQREKQVIECMADGLTNGEIAKRLHISKHTVGTHRKNILSKAKCSSATELLNFCRTNGIL